MNEEHQHQHHDDHHPPVAPREALTGRQPADRWHIARDIPLAVLVTLVIQTGAGVWFLSQMSARVDSAIETIRELRNERYTREDARRDRELFMTMFQSLQLRDAELSARLEKMDAKHERDSSSGSPRGGR